MRVALNLLYLLEQGGGVTRYMEELCGGLVGQGTEVVAFHGPQLPARVRDAPWAEEVRWVQQPHAVTHGPPWAFFSLLYAQWRVQPRLAREHGAQVLHGPAYLGAPRARGLATVVTVPDLIYTRYPDLLDWRTRTGMRLSVPPSIRGADRVIAISQTVKEDVATTLGVDRSRIDVTALGAAVDPDAAATPAHELRTTHGLAGAPVVLCVAQKRPHKNLEGLIRAFSLLRDPDAVLVLVGLPTPHEQELRELAEQLGVVERVRHVGYVTEADLEGLYRLACCCCLPSFEEGFGLPVIEAMARGIPVACSGVGALAEVAGDAAQTFDPRDAAAIAGALDRLLTDPGRRAALAAAGRLRAQQYTWERCARETCGVYARALENADNLARLD